MSGEPTHIAREDYIIYKHVLGMCTPFPWPYAYANGKAPEGKKSPEAQERALRLRHLFPAVHRASGKHTMLARLATDEEFYEPRSFPILRAIFTDERPARKTKKVPGSTGLPDDNRVAVVDRTGASLVICYWPDHYLARWKKQRSRARSNSASRASQSTPADDADDAPPRTPTASPRKVKRAAHPTRQVPKKTTAAHGKKRSRADVDRETAAVAATATAVPTDARDVARMTVEASAPANLTDARADPAHAEDFVRGVTLEPDVPAERPHKKARRSRDAPTMNRERVLRHARNQRARDSEESHERLAEAADVDTDTQWAYATINAYLDGALEQDDPELANIFKPLRSMRRTSSYSTWRRRVGSNYAFWSVAKYMTQLFVELREAAEDDEPLSEPDDDGDGDAAANEDEAPEAADDAMDVESTPPAASPESGSASASSADEAQENLDALFPELSAEEATEPTPTVVAAGTPAADPPVEEEVQDDDLDDLF